MRTWRSAMGPTSASGHRWRGSKARSPSRRRSAAWASIYGGLIASGWQTIGVTFRLAVEGLIHRVASMGSPGVDEVRWLKPVRPGDTITASGEVLEVRPSASKPDRGVIRVRYQA